jgi:hypothetical protein
MYAISSTKAAAASLVAWRSLDLLSGEMAIAEDREDRGSAFGTAGGGCFKSTPHDVARSYAKCEIRRESEEESREVAEPYTLPGLAWMA